MDYDAWLYYSSSENDGELDEEELQAQLESEQAELDWLISNLPENNAFNQ